MLHQMMSLQLAWICVDQLGVFAEYSCWHKMSCQSSSPSEGDLYLRPVPIYAIYTWLCLAPKQFLCVTFLQRIEDGRPNSV